MKTIFAALALTVAMPSLAQAQAPCRYSLRAAVCTIDSAADQHAIPRPTQNAYRLPRQPFSDNWQDWYNGEHGSMAERNHALSQQTTTVRSTTTIQTVPAPR